MIADDSSRDRLAALLGLSTFERLVEACGGRRIYVATTVQGAPRIVQAVGEASAGLLVDAFGGFEIEVPNRRPTTPPSRQAKVFDRFRRGWSDAEIVDDLEITERSVRRYRASWDACPGGEKGRAA